MTVTGWFPALIWYLYSDHVKHLSESPSVGQSIRRPLCQMELSHYIQNNRSSGGASLWVERKERGWERREREREYVYDV